jgi:hypothetical protein
MAQTHGLLFAFSAEDRFLFPFLFLAAKGKKSSPAVGRC